MYCRTICSRVKATSHRPPIHRAKKIRALCIMDSARPVSFEYRVLTMDIDHVQGVSTAPNSSQSSKTALSRSTIHSHLRLMIEPINPFLIPTTCNSMAVSRLTLMKVCDVMLLEYDLALLAVKVTCQGVYEVSPREWSQ